ncbi:GNAT family N-acetyltransferase [Nocardiopsis ganjiahuensis]|uniref:GNAT family N-acetyltransferase n=1 Tax=Nocardiopsis ganjiahuensis TaxID=239984 RepID=UPI000348C907|nr:GNAT family N-acetyltransferase [Nocardiopsis ganjiahuensis]
MTIREARPDDAPAIAGVHVRSWQAAYRGMIPDYALENLDPERLSGVWAGRLTGDLTAPGAGVLVAEEDGAVVAFAGFAPGPDPEDESRSVVDLETFYSVPEVWGSGTNQELARTLHEAMADGRADQAVLRVLAANTRARRFYEGQGWWDTGTVTEEAILRGTLVVPTALYRRSL